MGWDVDGTCLAAGTNTVQNYLHSQSYMMNEVVEIMNL
jgi:hypothetical protein